VQICEVSAGMLRKGSIFFAECELFPAGFVTGGKFLG
jgi:hypothetical protein